MFPSPSVMSDLCDRTSIGAQTSTDTNGKSPRKPSCVICSRRKIKCDRKHPCSACFKHGVECIYRDPLPPRRRKRQSNTTDNPHIRPYEEIRGKSAFSHKSPPRQTEMISSRSPIRSPASTHDTIIQAGQGVLITGGGNSVYLDDNLWTSVRNELPDAQDEFHEISDDNSDHSLQSLDDETSVVLGSNSRKSLTMLHPPPVHIFRLWQIYLDNVNPLIKILHGPTVQQEVLEATGNLPAISKEKEALMFSIYCIALVSMGADNVQKSFGNSKSSLLSSYRRCARLAFRNAGLLRTSNMMILQAFLLFLLSMRACSDPQTIWSLCGVAVRLAQRIGLHRDGSRHGLSIFETEMRRRLWLQLIILDSTAARAAGINPHMTFTAADVQRPLNVNDSDLDPRMTDSPREHNGPTEMIFCLTRNEFGEWLRRWSKINDESPGNPNFLISLSLEERDRAIDELENALESKFTRFCDKAIPLHYMTTVMAQTVVSLMRFSAHHPRQYSQHGGNISPPERRRIFSICLQLLENGEAVLTDEITRRYLWHVENHLPWDMLIYMLYELRHRINDEDTRRAWSIIDKFFSRRYQQHKNIARSPLRVAMQKLLMKAWKAHVEECASRSQPPPPCPHIVKMVSERRNRQSASHQPNLTTRSPADNIVQDTPRGSITSQDTPVNYFEDFGFDGNPETLDLTSMDWAQWDDLLGQLDQQVPNSEAFSLDSY